MRALIGGVGYRWQRDASFGLVVIDEMMRLERHEGVDVMDLGYGAIYAAQDIAAADPPYDRLVLIAGKQRGRVPGRLYTFPWDGRMPSDEELQERIREAGAGVIDIDHLLVIGGYFDAMPDEVTLIELEPVDAAAGIDLSRPALELIPRAVALATAAVQVHPELNQEVEK